MLFLVYYTFSAFVFSSVFHIKPHIKNPTTIHLGCHVRSFMRFVKLKSYHPRFLSNPQTAASPHRTARPSPWQRRISVPRQLENTHYSQVTLIHSGPAGRGPALTYRSLYYQHQECYNSFPQWPRY